MAAKDAEIAAKDVIISNLKKQLAATDVMLIKMKKRLAETNATIHEQDVEIGRLTNELDVNNNVNVVLGEVLSDLKKYEKSIIPTTCAQNCLRC
jgi:hypothetical protein